MGKIAKLGIAVENRDGAYFGLCVFCGDSMERIFASGHFFRDFDLAFSWALEMADDVYVDTSVDEQYLLRTAVPALR